MTIGDLLYSREEYESMPTGACISGPTPGRAQYEMFFWKNSAQRWKNQEGSTFSNAEMSQLQHEIISLPGGDK